MSLARGYRQEQALEGLIRNKGILPINRSPYYLRGVYRIRIDVGPVGLSSWRNLDLRLRAKGFRTDSNVSRVRVLPPRTSIRKEGRDWIVRINGVPRAQARSLQEALVAARRVWEGMLR